MEYNGIVRDDEKYATRDGRGKESGLDSREVLTSSSVLEAYCVVGSEMDSSLEGLESNWDNWNNWENWSQWRNWPH